MRVVQSAIELQMCPVSECLNPVKNWSLREGRPNGGIAGVANTTVVE